MSYGGTNSILLENYLMKIRHLQLFSSDSQIDTGKRLSYRQDRKDEEDILTRSHDHNLGYS
jgi:hypothetical protein